jgi:hypothetical protein
MAAHADSGLLKVNTRNVLVDGGADMVTSADHKE